MKVGNRVVWMDREGTIQKVIEHRNYTNFLVELDEEYIDYWTGTPKSLVSVPLNELKSAQKTC